MPAQAHEFDRAFPGQCEGDINRKQVILVSTGTIVVIVVVIVVVAAAVVVLMAAARRRRLQQRFGPEYDRAVDEHSSKLKAEAELSGRERRVHGLDIRPLTPAARASYADQWAGIQQRFVDEPAEAVDASQVLVVAVMTERGYPADHHDQVLADLSVEHAKTLDHYRAAEKISELATAGTASTEDLRQGMIHYRALFDDLLGDPADAADEPAATDVPADEPAATDAPADEPAATDAPAAGTTAAEPVSAAEPAGAYQVDADEPVAYQPVDAGEPVGSQPAGAGEPAGESGPEIPVQRTRRS
jgi:hypothetical protein